ncbi:MAG TPA: hypothetical protein VF598_00330, partial [Hymenobacter sp.]
DAHRLHVWQRNVARVLTERQLAQAITQRAQRGRTSDYAAALAATRAQAAFTAETGLTWAEVATL